MLRNVFLKALRDRRRSFMWWMIGIFGYLLMIGGSFSVLEDRKDFYAELLEGYPQEMLAIFGINPEVDLFSPAGYLQAEAFGWLVPMIFLIFAIGFGARAIAGEEEDKTMDLLLAQPISRRTVVFQKLLAMLAGLGVLAVGLGVSTWLAGSIFGFEIPLSRIAAAVFVAFLLGAVFGTIALCVGAATGRRGLALGISSGLAVAGYLINVLGGFFDWLDKVRPISPFRYYDAHQPLIFGLDGSDATTLALIAAVFAVGAFLFFDRRDVRN